MSKRPESYIEHSAVTVGRDDDYEIKISRAAGDEGWTISQGEDDETSIILPDDEAAEAFILAFTRLKEMADGAA